MADKLCIDLCSGLGGFSRAFVNAGWEVITVDIEPKFKPTICADITLLGPGEVEAKTTLGRFNRYSKVVIVAGPPCERFSIAGARWGWPQVGIRKALEIVGACVELIATIKPDFWLIENPRGYLKLFIGKPHSRIYYSEYGGETLKPTELWGSIHLGLIEGAKDRKKSEVPLKFIRGAAKRAIAPIGVSQAILTAVEATRGAQTQEGPQ